MNYLEEADAEDDRHDAPGAGKGGDPRVERFKVLRQRRGYPLRVLEEEILAALHRVRMKHVAGGDAHFLHRAHHVDQVDVEAAHVDKDNNLWWSGAGAAQTER